MNGRNFETEYIMFLRFNTRGKIIAVDEFMDTVYALKEIPEALAKDEEAR